MVSHIARVQYEIGKPAKVHKNQQQKIQTWKFNWKKQSDQEMYISWDEWRGDKISNTKLMAR